MFLGADRLGIRVGEGSVVVNRVIIMAGVAALASASPAPAQWTGSRIGKNAEVKDVGKLTEILAECVVKRRPKMVRSWFGELPGTDAEANFIKRQEGDLDICLDDRELVFAGDREMVYTPRSLRYPVALAFARKSLREFEATPNGLNPDGPAWFAARFAAMPTGTKVDTRSLALHDFGHCVASVNWQGARALVLSEPGLTEERAAVDTLKPSLSPCLDHKAQIKLTPQNLRVALAEPMAQILMASGTLR